MFQSCEEVLCALLPRVLRTAYWRKAKAQLMIPRMYKIDARNIYGEWIIDGKTSNKCQVIVNTSSKTMDAVSYNVW